MPTQRDSSGFGSENMNRRNKRGGPLRYVFAKFFCFFFYFLLFDTNNRLCLFVGVCFFFFSLSTSIFFCVLSATNVCFVSVSGPREDVRWCPMGCTATLISCTRPPRTSVMLYGSKRLLGTFGKVSVRFSANHRR